MRRYLPDRPLPPYAYVPGERPHPRRDPSGHAYAREDEPLDTAFQWGVDLYNHGYLWEAHEAWEPLWLAAAAAGDSASAAFFQGLIQCAAACLKLRSGRVDAAQRIAARAALHLERALAGHANTHGLELAAFRERFTAWISTGPKDPSQRPRIELERATD